MQLRTTAVRTGSPWFCRNGRKKEIIDSAEILL